MELNTDWIKNGIKPDLVVWADEFATKLYNGGFTTTKLRKFFGEVKRIQSSLTLDGGFEKETPNIVMLMPKLAYDVGRADANSKPMVKLFFENISRCIKEIDTEDEATCKKHFLNFVKLMEAVVAYHKAKGGQ
jgi:CRISPR-associated protein Csm2